MFIWDDCYTKKKKKKLRLLTPQQWSIPIFKRYIFVTYTSVSFRVSKGGLFL